MGRCYEFRDFYKKCGPKKKQKTYLDYLMKSDYSKRTKEFYAKVYKAKV